MKIDKNSRTIERLGEEIGFLTALILFTTIFYHVLSKFSLIPAEVSYIFVVSSVVIIRLVYSIGRVLKNE